MNVPPNDQPSIKMRTTLILLAAVFYVVEGLDCGIHMNSNDEMKSTLSKCISSNKTLENLWDITPMSGESDSSSSSEEDPSVDGKMLQSFRTKRFTLESPPHNETEQSLDHSDEAVAENCIIHCIFENLQMTDHDGYPIHAKVAESLLKNTTNRELTDFLQDSTDECFQEIDKESKMDPCLYTIQLVTCLADKGKANCADWPVGDLPFHQ